MPPKITILSISMPAVVQACKYADDVSKDLDFRIHYIGEGDFCVNQDVESDIKDADLLIIDMMGAPRDIYSKVVSAAKACKGQRLALGGMAPPISRLGGYDSAAFKMDEGDEEIIHRIGESWKRAEYEDIVYIFNTLLGKYLGIEGIPEIEYRGCRDGVFIRDPVTLRDYETSDDYFSDTGRRGKEYVVLAYSGNSYPTRTIDAVRLLFTRMSERIDVLPIAMNSYNIRYVDMMRGLVGRPAAIVNVLPFRFMAGPMGGDSVSATDLLRELDVPYFSPFFMTHSSRADWDSNKAGLDPMEFMLDIFLPELDGSLCTIPVGSKELIDNLAGYDIGVTDVLPIESRVDRIVGKVMSYVSLRRKNNGEKRVAIISYNYPPGEGNLFGGSFLDGAGSISSILGMLSDAGYDTSRMSADGIIGRFVSGGILNEGHWISPGKDMIKFDGLETHPEAVSEAWGHPPGHVMVSDGRYLIPGIVNGNVFVCLQPPRVSDDADVVESYHDHDLPPHHQYMAVYEWIRDVFKADAVVHLGTHGTLEFLPGKESATSSECYPDMIMGDSVHIYIYYVGNPSEAMIAKRRSHAGLISYMSPPFTKSGIYGDMMVLEGLISEYRESMIVDPGRGQTILDKIVSKAEEMRLPSDIEELEDELISIRESLIPNGLHRFGEAFSRPDAESYAIHAMEFPHDGLMSLDRFVSDPDELSAFVAEYLSTGDVPEIFNNDADAKQSLEYCRSLADKAESSEESSCLLKALEGRFIDVRPGGDMMKNPEVLPTGYNMIQFNPNDVPTMAAFERGAQAADDTIAQYRSATGEYPRSVALVLWGLETSRTQGMTIGQICRYLGLRMVSTSGDFAGRFEVIPLEELGRPRIDVTVSMCGFFRDMFPNIVVGLGNVFSTISSLDESPESNHCRSKTESNRRYLESKGYSSDELDSLAECRLFGPPRGEYGTSMTGLVNSSTWESEDELGCAFTESLHHAYLSSGRVLDVPGLLEENHSCVDIVSQVRDSADRELIDLDHYYEFLGGLSKAVEMARGGKASVFVVDSSRARVRTQDVKKSIEHGIRTRLLNPKWIDGLLKVRYHGAQNINDRFENVLGLAATTGAVESGVFSDMLVCYVEDQDMRHRIMENNNWAYLSMLNRLSEARSRGYWNATDEEIKILREAYVESEEFAEDESDVSPGDT